MTNEERDQLRQLAKRAAEDINRDYPKDLLQWRGKVSKRPRKKEAK